MGRPAIPVEPYIDKLVQALLLGAAYDLAAQYAGISPVTFNTWRKKAVDAKPGTPLALLRERIQEAEGRAAVTWLAHIEQAARDGNWQAAAWKLERRYPQLYGRTIQDQNHTGEVHVVHLPSKAASPDVWEAEVVPFRQLPPAAESPP